MASAPPVPGRITMALDAAGLYGPDVDRALGGEEPMVDEWELGIRVPSPRQLVTLARMTGFPVSFFFKPLEELTGTAWLCSHSGPRKDRCQTVELGPPVPPVAQAADFTRRYPGWWCRIPRCPLAGRRQTALTDQAAAAGWRRHYLDVHYQPPQEGR
ncbi:hypothetical protein [Nonomuraea sp. NPDC003214]